MAHMIAATRQAAALRTKQVVLPPEIGARPYVVPPEWYEEICANYGEDYTPFQGNDYGRYIYARTYARALADKTRERWRDTITRNVKGYGTTLRRHYAKQGRKYNADYWEPKLRRIFIAMYTHKVLPGGRVMWAMGSKLTEERNLGAAANNCAFVSTENLEDDPAKPFCFMMDMSMLGVGVGFDTRGAGRAYAKLPTGQPVIYTVADSREGWVECPRRLIWSYFVPHWPPVVFDFSLIRPAGVPLEGMGGVASGHKPLKHLLDQMREVLSRVAESGKPMGGRDIVDIMNMIGQCVVAGNVRRTAEIGFGDIGDEEFMDLKDYSKNPERSAFGGTCNLSVMAKPGQDVSLKEMNEIARRLSSIGEPGIAFLGNMQQYGRMMDPPNNKDWRATGGNPCLEQTLESYEMCNLVETNPSAQTPEEWIETCKVAMWMGKITSLLHSHWPETNDVLVRNRRVGISKTGIQLARVKWGQERYKSACLEAYDLIQETDADISAELIVNRSIKTTSVKPSGTLSALFNVPSGIHYEHADNYVRHVCMGVHNDDLVNVARDANYRVESKLTYYAVTKDERESLKRHLQQNVVRPDEMSDAEWERSLEEFVGGRETNSIYLTGMFEALKESWSYDHNLREGADIVYRGEDRYVTDPNTVVVAFPFTWNVPGMRFKSDVSFAEKVDDAVWEQRYWADNQVSCTADFCAETERDIVGTVLYANRRNLKGISCIARYKMYKEYPQLPFDTKTAEEIAEYRATLKPMNFDALTRAVAEDDREYSGCDGASCDSETRSFRLNLSDTDSDH
jgi:ribonucleoside-triphosphate reductase (thioredoxin)